MAHDLLDAPSLYDTDVLAWSEQQSALIRERRFGDNAFDWANIAEEIEDVGRNVFHACQSQLDNILTHLLKIEFVGPADTIPHWRGEIAAFRTELGRDLTKIIESRLRPELSKHYDLSLKRLTTRGQIIDPKGVRAQRHGYSWEQITDEDCIPSLATAALRRLDGAARPPYLFAAMAIRPILSVGDPREVAVLKRKSAPVEAVDDDLRRLMDDMVETMHDAPGIGLAAVQIGVPKRVIVMDLSGKEEPAAPRYFVNPEITWRSDELFTYEEGCLSVPEIYDEVERPARVRLTYLNYDGERVEEEAEGVFAVCIQHEMDHLDGVLFIDRLSRLKRDRAIARVRKEARRAA